MKSNESVLRVVLKAIALAMAVACIVLSIMKTGTPETLFLLLSIGLFALALWAFQP